jgi:hypothetical protein
MMDSRQMDLLIQKKTEVSKQKVLGLKEYPQVD